MLYRIAYVPFVHASKHYVYSHAQQLVFAIEPSTHEHLNSLWTSYKGEGLTETEIKTHCSDDVKDLLFKSDYNIPRDDRHLANGWFDPSDKYAVTFEVTQNCNMSCKHCWYGGKYKNVRGRTNISLGLKQMTDAANVLRYKIGSKPVRFLFFGGEPTLHLENIASFIEYANNTFEAPTYSMTTNLYEYDDSLATLCNEHDMRVTISIDGYKEAHDYGRVDNQGKPTFEIVKRNIEMLMSRVGDKSKLNLSIVITPAYDLDLAYTEIQNCSFSVLGDHITANHLSHAESDSIYDLYSDEQNANHNERYRSIIYNLADYIRKEQQPSVPKLLSKNWLRHFKNLHKEIEFGVHRPYYAGFCYPGRNSVYVKADGRFRVCLMADYENLGFEIGSIDTGVDEAACQNIYAKSLDFARRNCYSCKALSVCTKCVGMVSCCPDWSLGSSQEIAYCKSMRRISRSLLSAYYDLRTNSPKLLV